MTSMSSGGTSGVVVFREWTTDAGLTEIEEPFDTLEMLCALCLSASERRLIERVVLTGTNDQGDVRSVTFAFRAVTASDRT
jgi:hypothetical protein